MLLRSAVRFPEETARRTVIFPRLNLRSSAMLVSPSRLLLAAFFLAFLLALIRQRRRVNAKLGAPQLEPDGPRGTLGQTCRGPAGLPIVLHAVDVLARVIATARSRRAVKGAAAQPQPQLSAHASLMWSAAALLPYHYIIYIIDRAAYTPWSPQCKCTCMLRCHVYTCLYTKIGIYMYGVSDNLHRAEMPYEPS